MDKNNLDMVILTSMHNVAITGFVTVHLVDLMV